MQEAQALLPVLESLLRQAMKAKETIEAVDAEFQQLSQRIMNSGGLKVDIPRMAKRRAERDKAVQQAKDSLGEINATGVQVKDLDIGLLDFPCVVEDRVILLCWKMGEKGISHWHGADEGFSGRKPITDAIARSNNPEKPN